MAGSFSLAWLLLGATVPLTGTVVDAAGRPVAGATVWLGDTYATRTGPDLLATAETDGEGWFRLDRAIGLAGRGKSWSPTLWAYKPGHRLGHLVFPHDLPAADEPVRLAVGPPATATVRLFSPENRPVAGAVVRPEDPRLEAPWPPEGVLDHLAATTDADGWATIDGLAPADFVSAGVKIEGQLAQALPIDPDTRAATLRPSGRLRARIVGDDPSAVDGWTVTAWSYPSEPGSRRHFATQWARETTGEDGRVDFPPLAEGTIEWRLDPPQGSDYLVGALTPAMIRANETADVEIPIRRGVRVEVVVREEPNGEPIPGIPVHVDSLGSGIASEGKAATDERGRASILVPPGKARFTYHWNEIPADYFLHPGGPHWVDFEVPGGVPSREFIAPSLRRGVKLQGRVVDESGEPVAGADVSAEWTSPEFGEGSSRVLNGTDARGEFTLGNLPAGALARVTAWLGVRDESATLTVDRSGEGGPITLRLVPKPTGALAGRVVDSAGRPIADARVVVKVEPTRGLVQETELKFEGGDKVHTGPDGRYRTPEEIPADLRARVAVEAAGFEPAASAWLSPGTVAAGQLTLRERVGLRAVAGRVIDTAGQPVEGVEVFAAGDGPTRPGETSGADGRFRIEALPDAPLFLFGRKEGFHFLGQRIDAGEHEVELVSRRLDEPPGPLGPAGGAIPREEERAIALELAEATTGNSWEREEFVRRSIREITAMADPGRMIERIENQAVAPTPEVLASLAIGWSEDDPGKMREILEATRDPVPVALELFDRLGPESPRETRRELLEFAEERARAIEPEDGAALPLARVADRWFALGETERGEAIVREAMSCLGGLPADALPDPRGEVADVVARVDLPAARKLLERLISAGDPRLDRIRARMAERAVATDPDGARRVLAGMEGWAKENALRVACLRMARGDLAAARALAAEDGDPLLSALVPAAAARARADSDPEAARVLLREAVDRIGGLGDRSELLRPAPAIALARLLPLVARLDPERLPDALAMALALRPPPPAGAVASPPTTEVFWYYLDRAELAARVDRFDRAAAEVVFAPVADHLSSLHREQWGLGLDGPGLFRAAATFDARAALALLETLPADPPPPPAGDSNPSLPRHHSRAEARLAVARVLALPPVLRSRELGRPAHGENWLDALDD